MYWRNILFLVTLITSACSPTAILPDGVTLYDYTGHVTETDAEKQIARFFTTFPNYDERKISRLTIEVQDVDDFDCSDSSGKATCNGMTEWFWTPTGNVPKITLAGKDRCSAFLWWAHELLHVYINDPDHTQTELWTEVLEEWAYGVRTDPVCQCSAGLYKLCR